MKSLACSVALAVIALAAPAQADTLTAYYNDFDTLPSVAPGVVAGLSGPAIMTTFPSANSYGAWDGKRLFNIGTSATVFTLANLPTHTGLSASFILGFLGSWDSLDGDAGLAPDYLDIFIDGQHAAQLTYNNVSGTVKQIAGGTVLAEYDPSFAGPSFPQSVVDMSTAPFLTFAHSASTFTLAIQAGGAGYSGGSDEEWAIDALKVDLTGVSSAAPEPADWALMISGFGLAGAALRRRRSPLGA